jgi:hypothetical protein
MRSVLIVTSKPPRDQVYGVVTHRGMTQPRGGYLGEGERDRLVPLTVSRRAVELPRLVQAWV